MSYLTHICGPLSWHLQQLHLAHFGLIFKIFFYTTGEMSELEMHVTVCVIHGPLNVVTFHLYCYIGVRYLPPALSLHVFGPNELRVLTGFA